MLIEFLKSQQTLNPKHLRFISINFFSSEFVRFNYKVEEAVGFSFLFFFFSLCGFNKSRLLNGARIKATNYHKQ